MKVVWKTNVISRNYVSDFGASIKNIVGGRLITYERMIDDSINEVITQLTTQHPNVQNIKMQVTEFSNKSIAIVAYGEID